MMMMCIGRMNCKSIIVSYPPNNISSSEMFHSIYQQYSLDMFSVGTRRFSKVLPYERKTFHVISDTIKSSFGIQNEKPSKVDLGKSHFSIFHTITRVFYTFDGLFDEVYFWPIKSHKPNRNSSFLKIL